MHVRKELRMCKRYLSCLPSFSPRTYDLQRYDCERYIYKEVIREREGEEAWVGGSEEGRKPYQET
jgi:hypothetical protein